MRDDLFEAGLIKFLDEQEVTQEKVDSPVWDASWLIHEHHLMVRIRNKPGSRKPYVTVDIDFISGLGLEEVLAKGIVQLTATKGISSARQNIRDLKVGFCAFLNAQVAGSKSNRAKWTAQQFTPADLSDFATFLRKSNLSNSSRDGRVYAFKNAIFAYLEVANRKDPEFAFIDDLQKSKVFRSLAKDAKSTTGSIKSEAKRAEKFLSPEQLLDINDALEAEVRKNTLEWQKTQNLIKVSQALLDETGTPSLKEMRDQVPLFLGWLAREFPVSVPHPRDLKRENNELYKALQKRKGKGINVAGARNWLHATTENLLPFFLLLLIRTRYNIATLNDLTWSDIADRGAAISLAPYKDRAHQSQIRSEPAGDSQDPLSLRSILLTLRSMTDRIRVAAHDADKDKVFIYWSEVDGQVVNALHKVIGRTDVGSFATLLKKHNLQGFRASDIRRTMLDAIANGIEGLEGARREGNHSEAITTLRHYVSIRTSEMRRIALAETTQQVDRWAGTYGSIDPRNLPSNADLKSATPGFGCLNPYESPFKTDVDGRLCRSEGHCGRCQNAIVRTDDPKLVAYIVAYAEAASNATHLPPDVYDDLLGSYIQLLNEIPTKVLDQALQLPKPSVQIT